MNCSTGNKMSDAVAELNITGNVIPSVWFKTIVNDKGKLYACHNDTVRSRLLVSSG